MKAPTINRTEQGNIEKRDQGQKAISESASNDFNKHTNIVIQWCGKCKMHLTMVSYKFKKKL